MNKLAQVDIGSSFNSPFSTGKTVSDLVKLILDISFVIAGVGVLALLIFAGLSIIIGAGRDNPEQVEKGKSAATAALIGFIVIFGAYLIIQFIEAVFGVNFITEPGV